AGITTVVPLWKLPESTLYCVEATPAPSSVGVSVTVTSADCGPDGAFSSVVGAVLSMRTPVTAAEAVTLPALSVAIACRSYRPSSTAVVSKLPVVVCHWFWPVGEYWYSTPAMPEPASVDVEARPTVPARTGPGSVIVTVGAVLSTRTPVTGADTDELPAAS